MKTLLLTSLVVVICATGAFSQSPQIVPGDSLFMISVSVGPAWDKTKKPEDQPDYNAHVEWLKQIGASGNLKFGARAGNKGMLIVRAASLADARTLVDQDAAIRSKMLNAELTRLNAFHGGCLVE